MQQYEERQQLIEEGMRRLADKEAALAEHKSNMQQIHVSDTRFVISHDYGTQCF